MITLHPFQSDIVSEFIPAMHLHRRIVVACPTGSGKTVIAMHGLLPHLPKPVLWITHRNELLQQAERYMREVDVRMVQSYRRNAHYNSVIIDEGHHAAAECYQSVFKSHPKALIVALSATPYRLDGIGLGNVGFTKIIHGPDTLSLVKLGMLCKSVTLVPHSETSGAWTPQDCADAILRRKFTKAVAYFRRVHDAKETAKFLKSQGCKSSAVTGDMPKKLRADRENAFRNGATKVLCNHTIFTEGYDLPQADMVVLNRFTESRCLWKQMVGRALRMHPGKKRAIILDLAGNSVTHGSIYDHEIFDLSGTVVAIEQRDQEPEEQNEQAEYQYQHNDKLKIWKPAPKPISIHASLQKLKSNSPMHRFSKGFRAA